MILEVNSAVIMEHVLQHHFFLIQTVVQPVLPRLVSNCVHQALQLARADVILEGLRAYHFVSLVHDLVDAFVVLARGHERAFRAPLVVNQIALQVDC